MSAVVPVDEQDGGNQTTATVAVEEKNEERSFEDIWTDSTHQFLYATTLSEDGRDIHLGDQLVSILVLTVQFGLYIYLLIASKKDLESDAVTVKVSHQNCNDKAFDGNFQCDAIDDVFGPLLTAVFLFLAFIVGDIGGSLNLIFAGSSLKAKVTGLVLLAEVFLATLCCASLGRLGALESGAQAILAAVGVAFIHDLDEKVRLVYRFVPKFRHLLVLIAITVVIGGCGLGFSFAIAPIGGDVDSSD